MDAKELIKQVKEGKDPSEVLQEYTPEPSWPHIIKASQTVLKKAQRLIADTKKQDLGQLRYALDSLLAEIHMILAQAWSFEANDASKALNKVRDEVRNLRWE